MPQNKHRMRHIKALMIKEGFQIIRDPSSILISIVLPLFLMFLYGYGVSLDLDRLRIGLALEDNSPEAHEFAYSLYDSRFFDVKTVRDSRLLHYDLERGAIRGFVVVPSYFTQFRNRPSTIAPIQIIADGSEPNTANFFRNYVQGAFENWQLQQIINDETKLAHLARLAPRVWYNEDLQSRNFLLPGSLAIIMTLIGTLLTALVVAREWERGTMEALISTSITRLELIVGKLIPYFVLGMLSMTLCFIVTVVIFEVPFRGSLLMLALVSSTFLFCALGLGFMISTLAKNQVVAYQLSIVTGFFPAYILSGFLFEIASMPWYIQALTYLIPARYFVQCLQTLFLVGDVWSLLFYNMFLMVAVGLVFFTIAIRKTVKRLD